MQEGILGLNFNKKSNNFIESQYFSKYFFYPTILHLKISVPYILAENTSMIIKLKLVTNPAVLPINCNYFTQHLLSLKIN